MADDRVTLSADELAAMRAQRQAIMLRRQDAHHAGQGHRLPDWRPGSPHLCIGNAVFAGRRWRAIGIGAA